MKGGKHLLGVCVALIALSLISVGLEVGYYFKANKITYTYTFVGCWAGLASFYAAIVGMIAAKRPTRPRLMIAAGSAAGGFIFVSRLTHDSYVLSTQWPSSDIKVFSLSWCITFFCLMQLFNLGCAFLLSIERFIKLNGEKNRDYSRRRSDRESE